MEVQRPPKTKCIIGFIYSKDCDLNLCIKHLEKVFGEKDLLSNDYDFNITNYYENEMGPLLKRKFISFKKLVDADQLAEIKNLTNIIEKDYSDNENRKINLDPGYMDMDKFVLASAKYGRQKIYLNKGIYADPTLYYFKKEFHAYSWSFPDFTSGIYNEYFVSVRDIYKKQIRDL
jgi:Domain of unknown function (DUF4416)